MCHACHDMFRRRYNHCRFLRTLASRDDGYTVEWSQQLSGGGAPSPSSHTHACVGRPSEEQQTTGRSQRYNPRQNRCQVQIDWSPMHFAVYNDS